MGKPRRRVSVTIRVTGETTLAADDLRKRVLNAMTTHGTTDAFRHRSFPIDGVCFVGVKEGGGNG